MSSCYDTYVLGTCGNVLCHLPLTLQFNSNYSTILLLNQTGDGFIMDHKDVAVRLTHFTQVLVGICLLLGGESKEIPCAKTTNF